MTNFESFKMVTTIISKKGMHRGSVFLSIALLGYGLASCGGPKAPEGTLDRDQFVQVLMHFYLVEARLNTMPIQRDSAVKLFMPHEKDYLLKHQISDEQLKKTYAWYTDHPRELENVYDILIDSLTLLEQRALRTYPNGR